MKVLEQEKLFVHAIIWNGNESQLWTDVFMARHCVAGISDWKLAKWLRWPFAILLTQFSVSHDSQTFETLVEFQKA